MTDGPKHVEASAIEYRAARDRRARRTVFDEAREEDERKDRANGEKLRLANGEARQGRSEGSEEPRQPNPFPVIDIGAVAGEPIADTEFTDGWHMWGRRYCHNMSGDGGAGKTYLMAQKAVAHAGGLPFLGRLAAQGAFLFLSAEERLTVMRGRIRAICEAERLDPRALERLLMVDLSRLDLKAGMPWLLVEHRRTGDLVKTEVFWRLMDTLDQHRPLAAAFDNRARLIRANQNDANVATEAVAIFDTVADWFDMDITLMGHPSLTGIASGRGDSGSVGWSNAGRFRSYLRHADEDWRPGKPDNGKRILQMMKYSYGELHQPIELEWRDGRFYVEPPKADETIGRADRTERVFLRLLDITIREKLSRFRKSVSRFSDRNLRQNKRLSRRSVGEATQVCLEVTNNPASVRLYAPEMFSHRTEREGVNKREFEKAMAALLHRGAVEVIETMRSKRLATALRPTGRPQP